MMELLSPRSMVLLAETRMADVHLDYQEEAVSSGISVGWFCAIPLAILAIAAAIYVVVNRTPKIINTPLGLLHELCQSHRINRRGRLLLEEIAEANVMDQPAVLFAGANLFEDAVREAGKKHRFDKRKEATLGMLRRRLFS